MLAIHHLSKSFGLFPVLSDVSFTLHPGEKTALIGPNGCGKTTLLRILAGFEQADTGVVQFNPPSLHVGYLPQGAEFGLHETMQTFLQYAEGDPVGLNCRMESVSRGLMENPADPHLLAEYNSLLAAFGDQHDCAARLPAILASLGLEKIPQQQPLVSLSGGQKTRLGLAGILISAPALLLLDEPTNHLDFEMLEWLEDWLLTSHAAVMVVSHDRVFLDRVVTSILELDGVTHRIKAYPGNYSTYLEQKEAERARHRQEYQDQQVEIRDLTRAARHVRSIATFRKGGKADTGDKFARGFFADRGLATVKRAKHIEARIEQLLNEDRIEKPQDGWRMNMDFKDANESGRDVLVLRDLSVGYGETIILNGLNAVLRYGERVALVGPNGCGKTTLLRTAVGQLPPLAGTCRLGASVVPGCIAQEQEGLPNGEHVLAAFQSQVPFNETTSRAFLHKYLFTGDEVFTPINNLSYGQRARMALACLVACGCNFLMLDEPLNHLDLPSRAQFESALKEFKGTILTVVHDRYFIARYATHLWIIEEGNLRVIESVN